MAEDKAGKKILLVQAPPWGVYTPPLGIAYLVTFLKSFSFEVEILDLNMEILYYAPKEIKDKWDTQDFEFWASGEAVDKLQDQLENLADKILSYGASIIGFSVTFASVPFLNTLLFIIRAKTHNDATILLGGGGTSYKEGRSLFKKGLIDYFVIGEGEYPLLYLLRDIQEGNTIQTGPHYIAWKDQLQDHAVCLKGVRNNTVNIDEIPFPTFEEFDLNSYAQDDLIPLISSRGCVRSCAYCCDWPLKRPYRCRSPEKVAEEIRYHVRKYNRKRFEFSDLLINGNLNFLDRFCDLLIDMGLGVAWGGQAIVRRDMDITLFKKMKRAGCGGLTFGMESFSDRVLGLMRKGATAQGAKETLIKAKESGMLVEVNLIVGFPGETEADVDETINFIRQNSVWIDKINSLNICTIGPGMYIYDHLAEYNIEKSMINDWYAWFTKDMSNTIHIRTERHKRMLSVFSGLNLIPAWQNVKK
ncbi:B12-binding domain-containing radical SAM protein [Candidatus Omnitrophota bacterium]